MSKASSYTGDWSTGSNSGMSSTGEDSPKPVDYTAPDVAKREERAVAGSKILVFCVLLLAVCGAATATYLLMENQERKDFEASFAGLGSEVSTVAGQKIDQIYSALDTYSVVISSEAAADPNASWPFVTIPNYSLKSQKIAELVGLESPMITLCPIVNEDDRDKWPSFVSEWAPVWYQESLDNEKENKFTVEEMMNSTILFLHYYEFYFDDDGVLQQNIKPVPWPGPILANWQTFPLENNIDLFLTHRSMDMLTFPEMADQFPITSLTLAPSIGFLAILNTEPEKGELGELFMDSQIVQPIIEDGNLVAVLRLKLPWLEFFQNLNIDGLSDTVAVLRSSCDIGIGPLFSNNTETNVLSFWIDSSETIFLGLQDAHNPKYDDLVVSRVIVDVDLDISQLPEDVCVPELTLDLYPTEELEASFQTSKPTLYTVVVVAIFAFTSLVFLLYDYFVGRRQRKFMARIMRQDRIVSNVFPAAIRDRLYEGDQKGSKGEDLLDPLSEGGGGGAPLADLFLETTVVYADIAGFTAWSSAREPAQVFILLETLYGEFDKHAYRHSVFKVETVGDCYVAVAGLPEPDKDHAMAVCRFARDCVKTMKDTTLKLEVALGPDTSELELRVGIHSGQVTAGVLRGERSRFQLFGDTMNTASRMESTSARSRIQISQATADLLLAAGFSAWMTPRTNKILVKGKGEMQTYWLKIKAAKGSKTAKSKGGMPTFDETVELSDSSDRTSVQHSDDDFDLEDIGAMTKTERLVEWNVEVLSPLLQQIVASRGTDVVPIDSSLSQKEATIGTGETVLEEFVPIIPLKRFDAAELSKRLNATSIDIGEEAKTQLRNYIANVASMYQDNPFHNFEHASHVTASVKKLLTRIVKVDDGNGLSTPSDEINLADMAGHSY
eukprot:scaffold2032_cov122-Cylindrotheca_fusiformis.AAC.1